MRTEHNGLSCHSPVADAMDCAKKAATVLSWKTTTLAIRRLRPWRQVYRRHVHSDRHHQAQHLSIHRSSSRNRAILLQRRQCRANRPIKSRPWKDIRSYAQTTALLSDEICLGGHTEGTNQSRYHDESRQKPKLASHYSPWSLSQEYRSADRPHDPKRRRGKA